MRVQKMCQVSGGIPTPVSNRNQTSRNKNLPEASCRESLLWQGNIGTECVCYTDWCNSSRKIFFTPSILLLSTVILWYLR